MAKLKMIEEQEVKKMVEKDDFLPDFTAKKDHVIVQNNDHFEFILGKKASETNESMIPARFKDTLKVEGVLKEDK